MPKDISFNKKKKKLEKPVGGKVKVSSINVKEWARSEIDDIFAAAAAKKRKKLEVETNVKDNKPSKASSDKAKPSKRTNAVVKGMRGKNVKPDVLEGGQRKRTADGLPIYTMEELGMDEFGWYQI